MTEKRFKYYEHKGADYILDTPNESLDFIEMLGDCLEAEEIVDLLNELSEENKRLTDFSFRYTENYSEFDKDELEVKDTHTKINLKNGKLAIMVFVPETNDWFTFNYIVTGRRIMHEFMGLEK